MDMERYITDFMLVNFHLHPLPQKRLYTLGDFIFPVEQKPDILCQGIADLLPVFDTPDRVFHMVGHREKDGTVDPSENSFRFIEHFVGKLQADRGNRLYDLFRISSVRKLLQAVGGGLRPRLHPLARFLPESHSLSHEQIFPVILHPDYNCRIMIQNFPDSVHIPLLYRPEKAAAAAISSVPADCRLIPVMIRIYLPRKVPPRL